MDETQNLKLPYIIAAQAQKHVTHNESLKALDAIVQLAVLDRDLTIPPGAPNEGDRYIVGLGATGDWADADNQIAAWQDGAWVFYVPNDGWLAWVSDEDVLCVSDGTTWSVASSSGGSGSVNPTPLVGVNATADTTNRLSVNAPASLFNHDGNGHQQKINKAAPGDSASQLYQTNFSGRAEIGLTGDDDFHFKVSADGSTFHEAIIIDNDTGHVALPNSVNVATNHLINGDFSINQRAFVGGALSADTYGFDRWKAGSGGAANLSRSGDVLTLTSGTIVQVIETPGLAGKEVTVSVEDLSGGDLNIDVEGQIGTITAGTGRKGIALTVPGGSTENVTVKLTPASGAVTFKRVKLEEGAVASGWVSRFKAVELTLCQRYFERLSGVGAVDRLIRRGFSSLTGTQYNSIKYVVQKRAAPIVSLVNVVSVNTTSVSVFNPSVYEMEFSHNVTTAGGYTFFGYEADAEL